MSFTHFDMLVGGGVYVLCWWFVCSTRQAGALFAGILMMDSPYSKKAYACMQPLTSLFGGMYLGSLGMIVNPVRRTGDFDGLGMITDCSFVGTEPHHAFNVCFFFPFLCVIVVCT